MLESPIRPIGVYALSGLAIDGNNFLSVDSVRGYLVAIDPHINSTSILNPHQISDWIGATGLSKSGECFWFTKGQEIYWCDCDRLQPQVFTRLSYPVAGVAVVGGAVYASCQKSGYIHIFDRDTAKEIGKFRQPGVGTETLAIDRDALWVCDLAEQTVYCLDRTTGALKFSALTPYPSPTGIAIDSTRKETESVCYLVYADSEPYIRDDPNARSPYQLTFRDRTFIHPLYIQNHPTAKYTLSNGYLVELSYVEEIQPLEAVALEQVEWRMALPAHTLRQRIRNIQPIGREFTIEEQDGQKVAVFKFDRLDAHQGGLLGWQATIEMYSLKYYLSPEDLPSDTALPSALAERYLVDDDDLAMDTATMREAATEAIGTETNVLRQMLKIRNYVYDRLTYGIQPRIDTPDVALARGVGSCGEYVGVLLALARLNGIACRTIGRYKCPPYPDRRHLPLEPDFNHVWLEFYVPGVGWLPMESNVDDTIERGPYPQRFFMGLAWYHTEIGKGISFGKLIAENRPKRFSLRDLAINHIRFRILDELMPPSGD
jgi:hypothetical protein